MPRGSTRRSRPARAPAPATQPTRYPLIRRRRHAARQRPVARPPPTLLSLSVFTLLASIN
jgi:hypothetical protein